MHKKRKPASVSSFYLRALLQVNNYTLASTDDRTFSADSFWMSINSDGIW
jgi:hypothetical protein